MNALTRFDTNALAQLNRALVGFDRMFDTFETRFANQASNNYPPHNVVKTGEDTYSIEVAVAGFSMEEIDVEIDNNDLSIKGQSKREEDAGREYIHRGLARRDFEKRFTLVDHIEVEGASIKDGILVVDLKRVVPDALKPRKIAISAT
jgi:molecular chaperone IbpA